MTDTIQAALAHIPAHDRELWVRMAMAVKSELGDGGFAIWDTWSQGADNYGSKAARAVWKSIKSGLGVTIASLFHEAMQHGWQPATPYTPPTAEQRAAIDAERAAAAVEAAEIERQQRQSAKAKAAKLWDMARDVQATHPYLIAKGIHPEGIKQLRQMLVLPIRAEGELVSLQLIGEDGSKRFLTGGQVRGASLVLGKLKDASEALLCEGWATGCSLREATGKPVVVAFNEGNLPAIAGRLSQAFPRMALRVCGDTDAGLAGQRAAQKAASVHGNATWCCPVFTDAQREQHQQAGRGEPSDYNDLCQLAGLDAVRQAIQAPARQQATRVADGFAVSSVDIVRADSLTMTPVIWLWDGWLARGKLHLMAGSPGTGKTTIAMTLAATLTIGGRWPDGTRSGVGSVLIWSGEDDPADTLAPRLAAAGTDMSRVHFIRGMIEEGEKRSFDPSKDCGALLDAFTRIENVRLIIIDPIVSAVGGDSHKNTEVRRALQPIVDLGGKMGAAILGITHFSKGTQGRDTTERVIGSIGFAALARIFMATGKDEDGNLVLMRTKSNIGIDSGGFRYDFEQTELERHPGIFASRILWGDAVEGTAREVLSDAATQDSSSGDSSSLESATKFLIEVLEDGPVLSKDVKAEAAEAGQPWATVRRAYKALGVVAERDGFGKGGKWKWRLPDHRCSPNIKDAQQKRVSTFEKDEHLCTGTADRNESAFDDEAEEFQ